MLLVSFDQTLDWPRAERTALLGGKGEGLMRMAGELGLPVPPGFILTTDACRLYLAEGWTPALEACLDEGLAGLEAKSGQRFGGGERDADHHADHQADRRLDRARRPLLVSVRSGAPVSMPGMLDTLLNVGLDASSFAALAREDRAFAEACAQRLDEGFRTIVGQAPPADVRAQLRAAVEAVFRSARSPRALAYRRREGLEGDALTAVNVQAMVFGHRDERSATGVFFTRDPATGEPRPYGDVLFRAQGEDVVSGRHATLPFADLMTRLPDVARDLEAIGRRLERDARDLCEIEFTIESGTLWLLQVRVGKRSPRAALRLAADFALDPDFPLDRREAVDRVAALLASPPRMTSLVPPASAASSSAPRPASPAHSASHLLAPAPALAIALARGLGASPGLASGVIATTVEQALTRAGEGKPVVLVRPETSPEDVEGMAVATALLTARGGLASHAAVVARGWGIPAVVGLSSLAIDDDGVSLAGRHFAIGEALTVDGTTGEVFAGALEVETRVAPEAEPLLAWARELGVAIAPDARSDARTAAPASDSTTRSESKSIPTTTSTPASASASLAPTAVAPTSIAEPTPDDPEVLVDTIVHALSIKGSATRDALASLLGIDPTTLDATIARLVAQSILVAAKPIGHRLGDPGRARATALLAADRTRVGAADALAALVAFQSFDTRMKEAVTDWQLRLDGAERVPNDHTDARWDADVTDRLGLLCQDVAPWLARLAEPLPRLRRYATRLETALTAIRAGDGRFVASPRVDSLHGVWFELHEDLIRLAGSTRAEEQAAGRAG